MHLFQTQEDDTRRVNDILTEPFVVHSLGTTPQACAVRLRPGSLLQPARRQRRSPGLAGAHLHDGVLRFHDHAAVVGR